MNIQVIFIDGYLVFYHDQQEIYDIKSNEFDNWIDHMRRKSWWSPIIELDCLNLVGNGER